LLHIELSNASQHSVHLDLANLLGSIAWRPTPWLSGRDLRQPFVRQLSKDPGPMHCGDGIQNAEFLPKAQTVFPAPNLAVPGGLFRPPGNFKFDHSSPQVLINWLFPECR
jgi:hypothetical protein